MCVVLQFYTMTRTFLVLLGLRETCNMAESNARILVVDDEEPIRRGLARIISGLGHHVELAITAEEAIDKATVSPPDLVITDLQLPGRSGLELIADLNEQGIDATLVVLTAHGSIDSAIEATRRGVYDYLVKPVEPQRLSTVIMKGLERSAMRQEVQILRREMIRSGRYQRLVGKSPRMLELYRMIDQIAPTSASVLITGESGTGKEVVARTIHNLSPRAGARFIALNCAAIPETLLESEIFGHEKGSFTGATASRTGSFEIADKGTLFLDEIAEMPASLQSKLLRVLEERKVRRVGGTREIPIDVRVVAATNASVEERLKSGQFREDLYFRLNVFTLALPSLRDHLDDIPLLAQSFLEEYAQENQKTVVGFSEEALDVMRRFDWPGNVRELRNAVQRAVILCKGEEIQAGDLPPAVRPTIRRERGNPATLNVAIGTPLDEVERAVILETLQSCGGNKTRAASMLGISTKTLHLKLKVYRRPVEVEQEQG
jgi:DNA-binding NtrC family response regulator